MTTTIRTRRGAAADLAEVNRIYALGEAVWSTDTMEIRYGNNEDHYLDLKPVRMNNGAANVIMAVSSLTPDVDESMYLRWYSPGNPQVEESEGQPFVPANWSNLGSYSWSGEHDSTYNQAHHRVLLMLPGDDYPSVYAYVTSGGFLPIPLDGGQIVTVGCMAGGYGDTPSIWVGFNQEDDLGETDPTQPAVSYRPISLTTSQMTLDPSVSLTGNLSGISFPPSVTDLFKSVDGLSLGGGSGDTGTLVEGSIDWDFTGDGSVMGVTIEGCRIDINNGLTMVYLVGEGTRTPIIDFEITSWNQITMATTNGDSYKIVGWGEFD